jgi:hypothetical protein
LILVSTDESKTVVSVGVESGDVALGCEEDDCANTEEEEEEAESIRRVCSKLSFVHSSKQIEPKRIRVPECLYHYGIHQSTSHEWQNNSLTICCDPS